MFFSIILISLELISLVFSMAASSPVDCVTPTPTICDPATCPSYPGFSWEVNNDKCSVVNCRAT